MTMPPRCLPLLALFVALPGCPGPEVDDAGARLDAPSPPLDVASGEDVPPGGDAGEGLDAPAPTDDAPLIDFDAPAVGDAGTSASDPSVPGEYPLGAAMSDTVMSGGRSVPVRATVPMLAAGERVPLVIFLPGFQLRAAQYQGTIDRIASHGFVVVGADPPGTLFSVNHVNMAADAQATIGWALAAPALAPLLDPTRIAVMGHSLGGKLSTMVAAMDTRVTALLVFDPVNGGAGPSGYGPTTPDIVPDGVAPLTIPIGILGETNNASGGMFGMSCAPAAQNYVTFYDAATSSSWAAEWTLTGADHMDFLDNPMCGFTCSVCTDGPGDDAEQLRIARTLTVAFLRRHLLADASMDAWLLGVSVPAGATVRHRP